MQQRRRELKQPPGWLYPGLYPGLHLGPCPIRRNEKIMSTYVTFDKSIRVLCAEDNPQLRKVLVNIIKKIGYTDVVEAEDGVQAWEHVESGEVGLVLTDWSMPRMNGMELIQKIRRSRGKIGKLPILMITAADTKSAIVDAAEAGVDAYIIKPFSVGTIQEKIEEALAKRSGS